MLQKETKKKIDNCRDILVGVLPLPSDQVELITISLIYKFMDDIDEQSRQLGGAVSFFSKKLKTYSWQNLMSNQIGADERVRMFVTALEELIKAENIPELFKSIFRNTFLKFRDGQVFKRFLDEINYFSYDNSEELGNAFEYLLNTMGAQGENGQFRTPRNIIDFIVEVVDPDKDDKILDPACGTAGFLISAYKHILRKYTKGYENYRVSLNNQILESNGIHWGDKLLASQKSKLAKRIEGYDNTPLMVRLSQVNMYLHHFPNPSINDYDSISYKTRWNDKYDCILANPPFMTPKGGVKAHDQFRIRANKTEILFSDYIIEHLTPNGKAGWIVPEGIIFQNSNDYVELRKWLINDMGLWAVVSLPAQIFQPYSGVKTSILLVDRALARSTENIILVKIENDGFSLNTNRNPIKENDLPDALNLLTEYKKNLTVIPNEESNLKYKILHRKDFAKLDSYKSTTATIAFCKKEFTILKKAVENYEKSLKKELTGKQKQKAEERINYHKQLFLINTGFNIFPPDETSIKQYVEEFLKQEVILYGENYENRVTLSSDLKKAIDWQREYNLSIDSYFNTSIKNNMVYKFAPLSEVCIIDPKKYLDSVDKEIEVSFLPMADLGKYQIYVYPQKSKKLLNVIKGYTYFENDDLLIAKITPCFENGKIGIAKALVNGIGFGSTEYFVLRTNKNVILPEYIFYSLCNSEFYTLGKLNMSGSAGQQRLTAKFLNNYHIPIPPLEVQQKIVAEIEQYQKVIDGCNLVMQNYKPTFKIDECWEKVKLGNLIKDIQNGVNFSKEQFGSGIPFVNIKDLFTENGIIDVSHLDLVDISDKEITRHKLQNNDLLFVRSSVKLEGVGFPALIKTNQNINIVFCGFIIKCSLDESVIIPDYILYLLRTEDYREKVISLSNRANITNISQDSIISLDIPLPSLEEQQKIVEKIQSELQAVEQCKHLKTEMENKIKEVMNSLWQTNTIISPL